MSRETRVGRDIASIPMSIAEMPAERVLRFIGAVETAESLGYRVEVRVIRGPAGNVHSLVASASHTEAPDAR
jgi:hypothetical protein